MTGGLSLAQKVALLPEDQREEVLADVDLEKLKWDWSFWAREDQLLPEDDSWTLALALAGRGWGKTRTAMEWVRQKVRVPGTYGHIVARTAADVRDVLVEGPSGILAVSPPDEKPLYEPSKRRLTWANGSTATLFSSEVPDALRGPQSHWTVCDEIATWDQTPDDGGLTAWQNARIGTRLGANPQLLALTTPKRIKILRDLLEEIAGNEAMITRRGRMVDNIGNLSRVYLDTMEGLYGGTALAAQELDGQMLDDVEGALFRGEWFEGTRVGALPPLSSVEGEGGLYRPGVVVAVDPSVAERPRDEVGIVVMVGTGEKEAYRRRVYVVEDLSGLMPPGVWAGVVVAAARRWGAPVVAEYNQGGGLVRSALVAVDPGVRVVGVHSRVGKALRAETAVLAAQQGRLRMVGVFPDLESQLTTWDPASGGRGGRGDSPDRLDAMVHGANAFLTEELRGMGVLGGWGGGIRVATSREVRSRILARRQVALGRGRGMHPELGSGVGWGGVGWTSGSGD